MNSHYNTKENESDFVFFYGGGAGQLKRGRLCTAVPSPLKEIREEESVIISHDVVGQN